MNYSWSYSLKKELFLESEKNGVSGVELKSNYAANLFRYALYNFRKRNEIGKRFLDYQIIVEENKVKIYKSNEIEIKKIAS